MSVSRERIKFLNDLFDSRDFYPFLCAKSDNDVDKTIDNLSKIINYVLTTDEELSYTSQGEILKAALAYKKQGEYFIFATNSYLDSHIKLFGLSPDIRLNKMNIALTTLARQISYLDAESSVYVPVYGSIKKAIEEGFSNPKSLYRSILKQPSNDKQPAFVGSTETSYYRSILEQRLRNVPDEYHKTGAAVAKRILKEIIGKDITLYFIPTDREVENGVLYSHVSPFKLRSITIPSRYSLIMTCARNKGLKDDTRLSIDTGEAYIPPTRETKKYSNLSYYNYETVRIDENFKYDNEELTGDISYDIDELYGRFAKERTRETLDAMSLDEKIRKIKNSYDIAMTYADGKYHISNGRHRVLFLLHYYLKNYRDCQKEVLLNMLKDSTTIIAFIERKIEDPEINKILLYLERKYQGVTFLKVNILNDEFDIITVLKGRAYHLRSREDLIRFTNYLERDTLINEFYIGNNSNLEVFSYEILMSKLVLIFGNRILSMDLMDIINYLKQNPMEADGETINGENLNYSSLYLAYTTVIHQAELNKYRNEPLSIVQVAEKRLEKYERKKR